MFGRKMDPCEYNGIWADQLKDYEIVEISAEKGGNSLLKVNREEVK